jgi:hypothetical protein
MSEEDLDLDPALREAARRYRADEPVEAEALWARIAPRVEAEVRAYGRPRPRRSAWLVPAAAAAAVAALLLLDGQRPDAPPAGGAARIPPAAARALAELDASLPGIEAAAAAHPDDPYLQRHLAEVRQTRADALRRIALMEASPAGGGS